MIDKESAAALMNILVLSWISTAMCKQAHTPFWNKGGQNGQRSSFTRPEGRRIEEREREREEAEEEKWSSSREAHTVEVKPFPTCVLSKMDSPRFLHHAFFLLGNVDEWHLPQKKRTGKKRERERKEKQQISNPAERIVGFKTSNEFECSKMKIKHIRHFGY